MGLLKNLKKFFSNKKEITRTKQIPVQKLTFEEAISWRERGEGEWIKSDDLLHSDPSPYHEFYHRIVRIKYNDVWHIGKFRPFFNRKPKSPNELIKFLEVHTRKGRKMIVPTNCVYFKSYFKHVSNYKGDGDFDGIEKLHLHIKGDIKEYEKNYKILKTKDLRKEVNS